jgi:hypothetical protein
VLSSGVSQEISSVTIAEVVKPPILLLLIANTGVLTMFHKQLKIPLLPHLTHMTDVTHNSQEKKLTYRKVN